MLPSRSPTRVHGRPSLAPSQIIMLLAGGLFVVYFVLINSFFSFPSGSDTAIDSSQQSPNTVFTPAYVNLVEASKAPPPNALGGKAAAEAVVVATETATPAPVVSEHKWTRNPNRKYVWLDVAIDDEFVGRVTAELYADEVPKTAENFRALTTGELGPQYSFKNSVCHRILTDFIVQCGDFTTGKGTGGRSIYGRKFDDEPNGLRLQHSKRYILQMANSGPNTNGSQFCFMLRAAPHLNGKHVVFGEVVEGFEVVDKMENAGVSRDGIPLEHKVSFIDGGEYL